MKRTMVLGASPREERYSNKAVKRLHAHGHEVVAVARRASLIGDIQIHDGIPSGTTVHTVTMYLSAEHQKDIEEEVIALGPKRIIFNPGAENAQFAARAEAAGIEVVEGCTLVMLASGQF